MPPSALTRSNTAFAAAEASGNVAGPLRALTEPRTMGSSEPELPALPPQPLSPAAAARAVARTRIRFLLLSLSIGHRTPISTSVLAKVDRRAPSGLGGAGGAVVHEGTP